MKVVVGTGVKTGSQSIAFSAATADATIGALFTPPPLDVTNAKGAVTYSSSDPTVATVDPAEGAVALAAAGSTVITATAAEITKEGVLYPEATASYALTVAPPVTVKSLPYEETFLSSIGDFTTDGVQVADTDVWTQDSRYGMKATAYVGNANYESTSWLESPLIAIPSDATNPILTFEHAVNKFAAIGNVATEATVWIKEEGGQYAALTVAFPTTLSWTYVSSGDVDLSAYKGKNIQLGFKYMSTADAAGTWEIKNLKVEDASTPIETTISFAKESLSLTVGGSATNTLTTNSTGAVTYTSGDNTIAEVDNTGKVTAKAEGSTSITVSIAADGRYTAKTASYTVNVSAATGGNAPVGTVLWEETWTGGAADDTPTAYGQSGTTVFGSSTVTYSHALDQTKLYKDNNMDGSTSQENLLLSKKVNDVSGMWTVSGIPTGGASKALLKFFVNNANSAKVSSVTITSTTTGVTVGTKTQGNEAAKPFSFTCEIELGTATTFDLVFTNGSSANFRIDDITVTVTE